MEAKSLPVFQQFSRDHPPQGDDVHPVSAIAGQVEDPLHERGIDICHETVRFWWSRFGPMFAAKIRTRRVQRRS